jgi:hypothetical protein
MLQSRNRYRSQITFVAARGSTLCGTGSDTCVLNMDRKLKKTPREMFYKRIWEYIVKIHMYSTTINIKQSQMKKIGQTFVF